MNFKTHIIYLLLNLSFNTHTKFIFVYKNIKNKCVYYYLNLFINQYIYIYN